MHLYFTSKVPQIVNKNKSEDAQAKQATSKINQEKHKPTSFESLIIFTIRNEVSATFVLKVVLTMTFYCPSKLKRRKTTE